MGNVRLEFRPILRQVTAKLMEPGIQEITGSYCETQAHNSVAAVLGDMAIGFEMASSAPKVTDGIDYFLGYPWAHSSRLNCQLAGWI